MASSYGLYAYGVLDRSPEILALPGIDKRHPVFPVYGNGCCVMVSEIDVATFQDQVTQEFSLLAANGGQLQPGDGTILQSHEEIVDAFMRYTTVVPFQFGTILKNEAAVCRMLQEHDQKFKNLLTRFAGRVEWGLKVYADQQEFIDYSLRFEPEFKELAQERAGLSRGIAYLLGRKIEAELKDKAVNRLAAIGERIFLAVSKAACEEKLHKTQPQQLSGKKKEMILHAVYLVDKARSATFCQLGEHAISDYRAMGLDLEISGPWPPYSFI